MTLEEIEETLPNRFHDSEIRAILGRLRPAHSDIGAISSRDLNAPAEEATLVVSGVLLSVEPPQPDYPFSEARGLRVDSCDASRSLDRALIARLPTNSFFRSFFVNQWNAFIHIAGRTTEIAWRSRPIREERHLPGEAIDL